MTTEAKKVYFRCEHLIDDHAIGPFGGQTGAVIAEFPKGPVATGDKGICLSANGSCNHGCGPIEATTTQMTSGWTINAKPTPPIEPAS